jgi:carbonic anhydrase
MSTAGRASAGETASATDLLVEMNRSYARSFDEDGVPMPSETRVAVVACMDARLDVYRLLGLELGEAHVIRNAGGVVTEDAVRSLVISQRLLGTREIVLIHHTDCGMLTFEDDEVKRRIEADVGVRPPFALEAFSDLEADIRQSIRRLCASPFLEHKDAIRGFVYDVGSG